MDVVPFVPEGGEELVLLSRRYQVLALPPQVDQSGPSPAFYKPGRYALVYHLTAIGHSNTAALKVPLAISDSDPAMFNQPLLRKLQSIPGFHACRQTYFTPHSHPQELYRYPGLRYATLMPWISGLTWKDMFELSEQQLPDRLSWSLAADLAGLIAFMERHRIAHCDLSGGNVIVDLGTGLCSLVDFDDLYWSGAKPHPKRQRQGTEGYAKPSDATVWSRTGDRYSAAVLICEMLVWRFQEIRSLAIGECLFPDSDTPEARQYKYSKAVAYLNMLDRQLAQLFMAALDAPNSAVCPSLAEWCLALSQAQGLGVLQFDRCEGLNLELPSSGTQVTAPSFTTVPISSRSTRFRRRIAPRAMPQHAVPRRVRSRPAPPRLLVPSRSFAWSPDKILALVFLVVLGILLLLSSLH